MYFNQKSILAADYLRLSREDGDKLESDSIRNQRSLINDFVKQHPDITLVDEYIDDGYSGTNFERPAFKRLLEDVKKRKSTVSSLRTYPDLEETISKQDDTWKRYFRFLESGLLPLQTIMTVLQNRMMQIRS